ncbi:hypothetical protein WMY93_010623 [Mugilogobius chulae]|uniref:Peroxiredoxin-like 2A n=1 Tax=Mugilogobius chulae TaxID=88201 RepID=A0AAW0PGV9_9GOBI
MGLIVSAVAAVAGFLNSVMNFLTDPFLTPPLKAPLKHLEEAELTTLQGDKREEATELSSLKPELDELGEVFLDKKRRFYGPRERKMGLLGFLRVGVWMSGLRAFRKGFLGNVFGEGFVLGGVFVIGRGQQGILLEHREIEFGDKVNIKDVIETVRRMPRELQQIASK